MEHYSNKKNVLETVKVPLQSVTKTGKPIFAYLRRSTSKIEQADSLIQQEDGIDSMVKKLGYEKENIRYFAETYSGFENKKRKQWGVMTKEIDNLKEPCIIIARDISRLSRNPTDSQWIMDRLYGDNKYKQAIEKIYTLDYDDLKEWSKNSDKEEVHKSLSGSYYDSLDTKRKSISGIMLKLEKGEFPYRAPKGTDNFVLNGKRILKRNEKMPYIQRAFEMKAEGKSLKEITKYLKRYGDIKIGERDITNTLFKNPVYIGEYTEKTQGNHYTGLIFFEGTSPISGILWEKVQHSLGKKHSKYGDKQEGDVLGEKLRTADGRRMTRYLAKGKYANYTNAVEKIHITEKKILESFISSITDILRLISKSIKSDIETYNPKESTEALCYEAGMKNIKEKGLLSSDFSREEILKIGEDLFDAFLKEEHKDSSIPYKNVEARKNTDIEKFGNEVYDEIAILDFGRMVESTCGKDIEYLQQKKESQVKKLLQEKGELEKLLLSATKLVSKGTISELMYKSMVEETEKEAKIINEKIFELGEDSELEGYLQRLYEILLRTFELGSNAINKAKIMDIQEDLMKLLEITTFELTINNKKELKIKLFEVLEGLVGGENIDLEALIRFELMTGELCRPLQLTTLP